jgi:hypothetical protein
LTFAQVRAFTPEVCKTAGLQGTRARHTGSRRYPRLVHQLSAEGMAVLGKMSTSGQRPRVLRDAVHTDQVPTEDLPELMLTTDSLEDRKAGIAVSRTVMATQQGSTWTGGLSVLPTGGRLDEQADDLHTIYTASAHQVHALASKCAWRWVVGAGAAITFVIALRSLSMSPAGHRREPSLPPGELVGRGNDAVARRRAAGGPRRDWAAISL